MAGCLVLGAAGQAQAKLFKWVDENGNVHYGDKIPPQYAKQHHKELDGRGLERRQVDRKKTAEEIAAEQRAKSEETQREEKERMIKAEQARKDQILLDTFTVERDILIMRDDRLGAIDSNVKLTSAYNEQIKTQLETTQARIDTLEKNGREVPENLMKKVKNLSGQLVANETHIARQTKNRVLLEKQFDQDLARFRELKGIAPPPEPEAETEDAPTEAAPVE